MEDKNTRNELGENIKKENNQESNRQIEDTNKSNQEDKKENQVKPNSKDIKKDVDSKELEESVENSNKKLGLVITVLVLVVTIIYLISQNQKPRIIAKDPKDLTVEEIEKLKDPEVLVDGDNLNKTKVEGNFASSFDYLSYKGISLNNKLDLIDLIKNIPSKTIKNTIENISVDGNNVYIETNYLGDVNNIEESNLDTINIMEDVEGMASVLFYLVDDLDTLYFKVASGSDTFLNIDISKEYYNDNLKKNTDSFTSNDDIVYFLKYN